MTMARTDLLFELGTEELPAGSLMVMAEALQQGLSEGLASHDLEFETSQLFATPRRLAVLITGLAVQAPERTVEALGPPVAASRDADGNWSPAALGFAKKQGVDVETLDAIATPKGQRLGLRRVEAGATATAVLPDVIETAVAGIPVSKRMRWGRTQHEFLRPVQWLVALLGDDVVPVQLMDIRSDRVTRGHRFHHPQPISLDRAADYEKTLHDAFVLADFAARREQIRSQVVASAAEADAEAVIADDLLDEVTGLVEWPVALRGSFDPAFLEVPAGALISSMKEHQKYFHLLDKQGQLLPLFITIANLKSSRTETIIAGNEKVIRPRLSDAAFFFNNDKSTPLADRRARLETVIFQQKLGSLADKTERITALSGWLADKLGADPDTTRRGAELAKCDLVSDLVLEFPDLQGIAGAHYAAHDAAAGGRVDGCEFPHEPGPVRSLRKSAVAAAATSARRERRWAAAVHGPASERAMAARTVLPHVLAGGRIQ